MAWFVILTSWGLFSIVPRFLIGRLDLANPHVISAAVGAFQLAALWIVVETLRLTKADLGLTQPEDKRWYWAPTAAIVGVRCLFALFVILAMQKNGRAEHFGFRPPPEEFLPLIIEICLVSPIIEEFFYRGALQHAAGTRLPPWGAVALTSFLFMLSHITQGGPVFHLAMGVLFGVTRWRSGSLYPAIVLHAVVNVFQLFTRLDYAMK